MAGTEGANGPRRYDVCDQFMPLPVRYNDFRTCRIQYAWQLGSFAKQLLRGEPEFLNFFAFGRS